MATCKTLRLPQTLTHCQKQKKKKTITALESIKKHLDIDGLSHLVTLFTNFVTSYAATKNHNHDSSYAKTSHTHTTAQVANLDTALAGKAATSHTHTIAQVTNLQSQLDGKQAKGSYAASSHTHTIANVTNLQSQLDSKQAKGSYAAASHTHAWSAITGKPSIPSFLTAYPVGAVYISYSSTSPAALFGGSWTAITGRFPYFNAGTGTGGSNSHTLSVNELASHGHNTARWVLHDKGWGMNSSGRAIPTHAGPNVNTPFDNYVIGITNTGGNASHNNMPAYQTLYAWRRTA